jgi:hypothetical protein
VFKLITAKTIVSQKGSVRTLFSSLNFNHPKSIKQTDSKADNLLLQKLKQLTLLINFLEENMNSFTKHQLSVLIKRVFSELNSENALTFHEYVKEKY